MFRDYNVDFLTVPLPLCRCISRLERRSGDGCGGWDAKVCPVFLAPPRTSSHLRSSAILRRPATCIDVHGSDADDDDDEDYKSRTYWGSKG